MTIELEREITTKHGVIASNLPKLFHWQRLPDLPFKNQHKKPYDGLLWFKNHCWPIEVKMNGSKLTEGELATAKEYKDNGIDYLILRYYTKFNSWTLEVFEKEGYKEGQDLKELFESLAD
jgi:hypothetical protein